MLTEVPEGWLGTTVGGIVELQNGYGFKSKDWAQDGLPIIRIQNLNGGGDFNYFNGKYDEKYLVQKGDLLFCWSGSRGTSFGARYWTQEKGLLNQHIFKCIPKDGAEKSYIYYLLDWMTVAIEEAAHGGAGLAHIKKSEMVAFPCCIPPLNEQLRIAEILSSVDASIQATQAVIEQAERVKRGLMEELLTGGLGSEAIERGEVPEGWQLLPLGEFAKIKNGFAFKSKEFLSDDSTDGDASLVVRMSDFNGGYVDTSHCKRIQKTTANGLERFRLKPGDILVAMSGATVGKLGRVPATASELYLNQRVGCMQPTQCSAEFLWQLVNTPFFQTTVLGAATGNAQPNISSKELEKIQFAMPPEDTQHRIVSALTAFDDFIATHKVIVEQQNLAKRGLMDDLLTGKVRTV